MVLDVVECNTNGSIGFLVTEFTFYTSVGYLRHIVVVPPEVL